MPGSPQNAKHERFCRGYAVGETVAPAYVPARYRVQPIIKAIDAAFTWIGCTTLPQFSWKTSRPGKDLMGVLLQWRSAFAARHRFGKSHLAKTLHLPDRGRRRCRTFQPLHGWNLLLPQNR